MRVGGRSARQGGERPAQVAACAVAALANVALVWFLLAWREPMRSDGPGEATELVWIVRTAPVPPVRPVVPPPVPAAPVATPRPPSRIAGPPPAEPDRSAALPAKAAEPAPPAAPPPSAAGTAPRPDAFRRDAFSRTPADPSIREDRMALRFQDRSIGGRLQEMTRRGLCGDLRKALLSGSGSPDVILASMKERGCEP